MLLGQFLKQTPIQIIWKLLDGCLSDFMSESFWVSGLTIDEYVFMTIINF